ncbi:hypothetical protein [Spirochaeta dissipatitropha]
MKIKTNYVVYFLLCGILLTFTACLDIHTEIDLNSDGSGRLLSTNSIPKELLAFSAFEAPVKQLQLSLRKEYIDDYIGRLDGVTLHSYNQKENETHVIVETAFHYDSFEALQRLLQAQAMDAREVRNAADQKTGIALLIARGAAFDVPPGPFSDEIAELVNLTFSLAGPDAITRVIPDIKHEKAGSRVSFSIPVEKILYSEDDFWLEFHW